MGIDPQGDLVGSVLADDPGRDLQVNGIDGLRQFLCLKNGGPSHDTFIRLFRLLDPDAFRDCFQTFVARLAEACEGVIAIDGALKIIACTCLKVIDTFRATRLAADPGFVHFDVSSRLPANSVLVEAHHSRTELVKNSKCHSVALQVELPLQLDGRDVGGLTRDQICCPEQYAQWRMAALNDSADHQPGVQ